MDRQEQKLCTYAAVYGTAEEIVNIDFAKAEKIAEALIAESADFHEEYLNEGMVNTPSEDTEDIV